MNKLLIKLLGTGFVFLVLLFGYGLNAQAATPHPPGTLINNGGTIWVISADGTERQSFDSWEKFLSHRYSLTRVVTANAADLTLKDQGAIAWGNGVLFNDNGTIYQVTAGAKHGFSSAEALLGQGFQFGAAVPGNLSVLSLSGVISNPAQAHLPGTMVRESNGTIWHILSSSQRRGIPTLAALTSLGVPLNTVVPANQDDLIIPTSSIEPYRAGTLVSSAGTVWLVAPPKAYPFPSAACFTNFGFRFDMVISGDTAGLTTQSPICGEDNFTTSYAKETLNTSRGAFTAHVAKFNFASGKLRLITDTAADSDCSNNCAVASLSAYATASQATAGMNGTYFCPPDYSDCAGKTNSFFWKVFDTAQNKMINAKNGLGENDPFLVMGRDGKLKYFSRWRDGKDYPMTAGINSAPALISDAKIILDEPKLDDKQRTTKSNRGAIGMKGQVLYLVIAQSATVIDLASIMQNLGVDFAVNLDGGGSSAMLYQSSYKVGPGRNLPNAILIQELP